MTPLLAFLDWHTFFFTLFAAMACFFALGVLFSSNIVRMAFYLIISLGATSGLFFLAGAEFLGAMQLMIYVGGTLVLLIFGVMLTAQKSFISMKTRGGEWVLAAMIGGTMLLLLLFAAFRVESWRSPPANRDQLTRLETEDTARLGGKLASINVDRLDEEDEVLRRGMSGYLLPFEIASVHLLVVLIGAGYLARTKKRAPASAAQYVADAQRTEAAEEKRRPLLASLLLGLILLQNILLIPAFLFFGDHLLGLMISSGNALADSVSDLAGMVPESADVPGWVMPTLAFLSIASSICVLALFGWKKWGFYGLCVLLLVQFVVIGVGVSWLFAGGGIVGIPIQIGILFLVLKIGGTRGTWAQLE